MDDKELEAHKTKTNSEAGERVYEVLGLRQEIESLKDKRDDLQERLDLMNYLRSKAERERNEWKAKYEIANNNGAVFAEAADEWRAKAQAEEKARIEAENRICICEESEKPKKKCLHCRGYGMMSNGLQECFYCDNGWVSE